MRNRRTNAIKKMAILLFIASIILNACFFAGCKTLHDAVYGNPCEYGEQVHAPTENGGEKQDLVRIAEKLGIKTVEMTASGLASDIFDKLDHGAVVPTALDVDKFEKMTKHLNPNEEEAMREYQRFITDLQGKSVIVIEKEPE